MGHKVNPKIFRTPLINEWQSKWFAKGHKFRQFLKEDIRIRNFLDETLKKCDISKIDIERNPHLLQVVIHTAKPGLIIGRGGVDIEEMRKKIQSKFLTKETELKINIVEETSPMLSARIILERAIEDLEKRIPYRRVLKKTIKQAESAGVKGVKILVKGRLGGIEIARSEKLSSGKLPLHTLRADIDYIAGKAHTTYGSIGVKVWVYKGEKF